MSEFDPLYIDLYPLDTQVNWQSYCTAGLPWLAVDLKATEGLQYSYETWMAAQIAAIVSAAGSQLGVTFWMGAYHYLRVTQDGCAQADYYINACKQAGGFSNGWWLPMVDVESADNSDMTSPQQIIDSTSAFANRIHSVTGMKVRLYGESFLADNNITDQMSCDYIEIARYDNILPEEVVTNIGWTEDKLFGWQYRADDYTATLVNAAGVPYPNSGPGTAPCDIIVLTLSGGTAAIPSVLSI
jgi:GH25 family lysozyme M1 (1,4-beta-N-acetylmuramidase)